VTKPAERIVHLVAHGFKIVGEVLQDRVPTPIACLVGGL
jgi:hypothetical protein